MQRSENKSEIKNFSIFASGRGSNARAILEYFKNNDQVKCKLIVSNQANARVLDLGEEYGIETMVIDKSLLYHSHELDEKLRKLETDLIVLAGFLWLIPDRLVNKYPKQILNIHPALLPGFGGKGMYGMNVHKAVKAANKSESGITIHFIDEEYDKGQSVFQAKVALNPEDSANDIAEKVLKLEHYHFPRIIDQVLLKMASKK